MKIFIGADHRGCALKEKIINLLQKNKFNVQDLGAFDCEKSVDYPKIAYKVAKAVTVNKTNRGILICMSGIGQAMAANKVNGAYAALCYNSQAAQLSRQHNNANILVLGAKFIKPNDIAKTVNNFLNTEFEGGRHLRRVNQIKKIEKGLKLGN
ncbi:MAG: ribose 5-phosphate isomerase B [Candidatus Omnitrophica bacterium]|nr:ribose 5-phosphate isomerase B [Candidatus Omnitrophota bacterium]MCB9747344.1 ribose 5-phosphate isomerase B [Candidatus Omnitrophota bacterium]